MSSDSHAFWACVLILMSVVTLIVGLMSFAFDEATWKTHVAAIGMSLFAAWRGYWHMGQWFKEGGD